MNKWLPLTRKMQFACDKNFEHAHRCYDQALQMNSESVSTHAALSISVWNNYRQVAAWLCKARALFAASTFDDAIQVLRHQLLCAFALSK